MSVPLAIRSFARLAREQPAEPAESDLPDGEDSAKADDIRTFRYGRAVVYVTGGLW